MSDPTDEKKEVRGSAVTRLQEGQFRKGGVNPPPASPPPPPPPPPQRPAQNKNDDGKK